MMESGILLFFFPNKTVPPALSVSVISSTKYGIARYLFNIKDKSFLYSLWNLILRMSFPPSMVVSPNAMDGTVHNSFIRERILVLMMG